MPTRTVPRVLILVNADYFFVTHRLAIGRALREAGLDVIVAAHETTQRATIEGAGLRFCPLPITRAGRSPAGEAVALASIVDLYRRERPDVVHHVSIKPVLYGSLAARLTRVPAVINAVSGLGFVFIERPTDSWREHSLRAAAKGAYRMLVDGPNTRVLFQNPDDRAQFVNSGYVREASTVLIRGSGVNVERFPCVPLPASNERPVVMFPSRLLWDKGAGEFVHAARTLKAAGCAARFVLVGWVDSDNPACVPREQVEAWVREGAVEWWGNRTAEEMPAALADAHVVVLPSYREGLPLVLAEAAATGRACVTSDVPGCREIVRHGENGWLVPVRDGDALARTLSEALADPAELAARGLRGRRMAEEEFSQAMVVRKTLDVYRELLGPRFPVGAGCASKSSASNVWNCRAAGE